MNMHDAMTADRTLLPRGLVGRPSSTITPFEFEIGDLVTLGGNFWVVLSRDRSSMGRQFYEIYRPEDERPVRQINGDFIENASIDEGTARKIARAFFANFRARTYTSLL